MTILITMMKSPSENTCHISEELLPLLPMYLEESAKRLRELTNLLVEYEIDCDCEKLDTIFRQFHTMKGSACCLQLEKSEQVMHGLETLVTHLKAGDIDEKKPAINVLLQGLDYISSFNKGLENQHCEPDIDIKSFLNQCSNPDEFKKQQESVTTPIHDKAVKELAEIDEMLIGRLLLNNHFITEVQLNHVLKLQEHPSEKRSIGEILIDERFLDRFGLEFILKTQRLLKADESPDQDDATPSNQASISISPEVLENLGSTRDQLVNLYLNCSDLASNSQEEREKWFNIFHDVILSMHETLVSASMLPLNSLSEQLPRAARDLADSCDKKVRVNLSGGENLIAKNIYGNVKGIILHMIRNAIDHGIESPSARINSGKPEYGNISIEFEVMDRVLYITFEDDGAGIDLQAIKDKAIALGEDILSMSDNELLQYILKPQFSTAKEITNISGRGIGLDAVNLSVEEMGGNLSVESATGKGCMFFIQIPQHQYYSPLELEQIDPSIWNSI